MTPNPSFWADYYASRPRREGSAVHRCARRDESFAPDGANGEAVDVWGPDDCCSHCGSLDPDVFMARLEAGDVRLTPTDKSYKVYVGNAGGAAFKQCYRPTSDGGDDPKQWVWTTRDQSETKFYFQHLSVEQRKRFIELLNTGKLALKYPGHFYRLPFFISRGTA